MGAHPQLETKPEVLKSPGTIQDFTNNGRHGHIVIPNAAVSSIAQLLE